MKILTIPAILVAFTFHEYAHAIIADRLGDKTPKFQGRLTLNPIVHIDIVGFLMIMLVGFGWAKPVQTNPRAYKNYYKDDLKVSIAGPIANLLVATVFAVVIGLYGKFVNPSVIGQSVYTIIYMMLYLIISINVMLFFFNLLPIPGLDGFHVLRDLFPSFFYKYADQLYRYQMFILIIIVATPVASYIIGGPTSLITNLLFRLADFISML
jgi:Zn-dependent protease